MSDALVLLPSAEELATRILLDTPHAAALWADRVWPDLQAGPLLPAVVLERGGGPAGRGPYWLDRPYIVVQGYGRTKDEAERTTRTAHAVLLGFSGVVAGVGVVTGVGEVQGVVNFPDRTSGLPRYLFSVEMTTHPIPPLT